MQNTRHHTYIHIRDLTKDNIPSRNQPVQIFKKHGETYEALSCGYNKVIGTMKKIEYDNNKVVSFEIDCWYSDRDGESFSKTNHFDILKEENQDLYIEIPTENKAKHESANSLAIAIGSKPSKKGKSQGGPVKTLRNSKRRVYDPIGAFTGKKPFHTLITGTPQPDDKMTNALSIAHQYMTEGSTSDWYKSKGGRKRKTKRRSYKRKLP